MTSRGNGQRRVYDVKHSEQTKATLKGLHRQAVQAGWGQEFVAALRHVAERLRNDPFDFGEPLFRLPALKLIVRQAVVGRLAVDYAVHEDMPLVFLRSFKLLS